MSLFSQIPANGGRVAIVQELTLRLKLAHNNHVKNDFFVANKYTI
jgi:hypothetical protein